MNPSMSEVDAELLAMLPSLVGIGVALSGRSDFLGLMREMAVVQRSIELAGEFGDNPLIQTVVENPRGTSIAVTLETVTVTPRRGGRERMFAIADFVPYVLESCRQANRILQRLPDQSPVNGYRRWLLRIADDVAGAAGEGSILGIWNVGEAEKEKEMMRSLREIFTLE